MRTWLIALTNHRILLINCHLIIGSEYMQIPLEMIDSVSCQSRILFFSITIMHGSGGIIIDNVVKGCEKPFVECANDARYCIKEKHTEEIIDAIKGVEKSYSLADEILKLKELANEGIITQEEFEKQKTNYSMRMYSFDMMHAK